MTFFVTGQSLIGPVVKAYGSYPGPFRSFVMGFFLLLYFVYYRSACKCDMDISWIRGYDFTILFGFYLERRILLDWNTDTD